MTDTPTMEHQSWLTSGDFTAADEPFGLFAAWLKDATASEPNDPNAMALATVDASGLPDVRMVLLKGFDSAGFVFYTNIARPKGRQLADSAKAALVFHWKSLRRQVRVRGTVTPVTPREADEYFATRPRPAQIGAWASKQSQPLESRFAFEQAIATETAKHWSAPCHGRRAGAATASPRNPWSSGTTVRSGCMTASCSSARHRTLRGPGPDLNP